MKILIFPTDPLRAEDFDIPAPIELSEGGHLTSWSDEEREVYARYWAHLYKSDIVMLVEE